MLCHCLLRNIKTISLVSCKCGWWAIFGKKVDDEFILNNHLKFLYILDVDHPPTLVVYDFLLFVRVKYTPKVKKDWKTTLRWFLIRYFMYICLWHNHALLKMFIPLSRITQWRYPSCLPLFVYFLHFHCFFPTCTVHNLSFW